MSKYKLSFTIETDEDPSHLLDALQEFAVTLVEDDEDAVDDVEQSCCVQDLS
jgi:hypothetical protein